MKPKKQHILVFALGIGVIAMAIMMSLSKDDSPPETTGGTYYYSGPKRPKGGGVAVDVNSRPHPEIKTGDSPEQSGKPATQ